jgi:hypothetical protein
MQQRRAHRGHGGARLRFHHLDRRNLLMLMGIVCAEPLTTYRDNMGRVQARPPAWRRKKGPPSSKALRPAVFDKAAIITGE